MLDGLTSPKWCAFQESLAHAARVSVGIVLADGSAVVPFNAGHLTDWVTVSRALLRAYVRFLRGLCAQLPAGREPVFAHDPLGLPAVSMRIDQHAIVVLGGVPHDAGPSTHAQLSRRLAVFGVAVPEQCLKGLPAVSPAELLAKAHDVRALYEQLSRALAETTHLGRKSLALAAVDQINRLVLGSLGPDEFDLGKVLQLAASLLVMLLDAEAAWAFSAHWPSQLTTVWRGVDDWRFSGIRRGLEQAWAELGDLQPLLSRQLVYPENGEPLRSLFRSYSSRTARLTIGVLTPPQRGDGDHAGSVLGALLAALAVSCELSSLYCALRRQMGTVLNAMRHPVVVVDFMGRAGVINRAAAGLLAQLGVELRPGQCLYGRGLGLAIEAAVAGAIRGKTASAPHERFPGGLVLSWSASPLTDDDQSPNGAVLVFEDVTEFAQLRQHMLDRERITIAGQMAVSLAHEIRSPLAAASGAIQLAQLAGGDAKREDVLARLQGELERINGMLSDYLALARPQGPHGAELVDMCELLREVEPVLRGEAGCHDVDLVISLPSEKLPPVRGEAAELRRVFLNIGKNAFEAMPDGGHLHVALHRDGQTAVVEFQDTGSGIAEQLRSQVFRPFFTTKVDGTGLGLTLCSTIVRAMGGEIAVADSDGTGARIVIRLPLQVSVAHAACSLKQRASDADSQC